MARHLNVVRSGSCSNFNRGLPNRRRSMISLTTIQVAPSFIQRHIPEFQPLSQGFGRRTGFKLDSPADSGGWRKVPAGAGRICYADIVMIELSQPAQCLFCPQRRKIALLLKLVMAGSAAIITAIILFHPGNKRAASQRNTQSSADVARPTAATSDVQVFAEGRALERTNAGDAVLQKSAEILAQAQERFQAVQAQMRPLLSEDVPALSKAQKLLDERRREVLKTKVVTLGDELFSGSGAREAHRRLVLEALDKELSVLQEQQKLLTELKRPD